MEIRRCYRSDNDYLFIFYSQDNILEASQFYLFLMTAVNAKTRTKFRRDANKADNKAATAAVDSLLNYEAVKVRNTFWFLLKTTMLIVHQHFNNEMFEVAQYDKHLRTYEKSSIKITTSLAFLNSGQNVIYSSALTAIMFMAAQGVLEGTSISIPIRSLLTLNRDNDHRRRCDGQSAHIPVIPTVEFPG